MEISKSIPVDFGEFSLISPLERPNLFGMVDLSTVTLFQDIIFANGKMFNITSKNFVHTIDQRIHYAPGNHFDLENPISAGSNESGTFIGVVDGLTIQRKVCEDPRRGIDNVNIDCTENSVGIRQDGYDCFTAIRQDGYYCFYMEYGGLQNRPRSSRALPNYFGYSDDPDKKADLSTRTNNPFRTDLSTRTNNTLRNLNRCDVHIDVHSGLDDRRIAGNDKRTGSTYLQRKKQRKKRHQKKRIEERSGMKLLGWLSLLWRLSFAGQLSFKTQRHYSKPTCLVCVCDGVWDANVRSPRLQTRTRKPSPYKWCCQASRWTCRQRVVKLVAVALSPGDRPATTSATSL
ncbi:hypothetical protein L596_013630 [Steinernema carpocapsae]|nr:hypothetical protein L596_013630 [Steinernema carpocapsae]